MTLQDPAPGALRVGVDVGGTKVAVLVVDPQGRVRGRRTEPTVLTSPSATLAGIAGTIRRAVASVPAGLGEVAAVGLGIPGRVDPASGLVRNAVNLHWQELPAGALLSAALGVPCFLENDVRLATLGVHGHPDFAAVANLAYVSVGTGIAAGLILGGRLYRGTHGMAGEIGHTVLDPAGPRCGCGLYGCLEALAAGPAIARAAATACTAGATTTLCTAPPPTTAAVYHAAGAGDAVAQAITRQAGAVLARALQHLVMSYDVEQVVIGGGVTRAGQLFWQPVAEALALMRDQSALARELLPPQRFVLLPADYEAGPWGGVALAALGHGVAPG